jgi:SpoIID/LytB domain protein
MIRSTYHRLHSLPRRPSIHASASRRVRPDIVTRAGLGALAGLCAILTLFCPSPANASTLVIAGAGDGHGVGMSQDGAFGYAQHGASYQAILAHYYTGTAIGQAPAGTNVRVLIGGKVQTVALETYVRGVVSAEVPASWPLAVLEAQAVASRTYALTAHAGGSKFDVYADTRSQVYRGVAAETAQTDVAVADTAGQVVTYEGRPAITYFFADSGGMTENVDNAFPGAQPEPWLRGVTDPYAAGAQYSWKLSISFAMAAARLKGLVKGGFRGVEVLKRGVSPRIVNAEVLGTGGATQVSGPALAGRLGLGSTWAYFSVQNGTTVRAEGDRSGQPAAASPSSTPAATPVTTSAVISSEGGARAPGALATTSTGGVAAG